VASQNIWNTSSLVSYRVEGEKELVKFFFSTLTLFPNPPLEKHVCASRLPQSPRTAYLQEHTQGI